MLYSILNIQPSPLPAGSPWCLCLCIVYASSSGRCEGLLVTVTACWRRPEWRRAAVATRFPHLDSGTLVSSSHISTLYLLSIYSCFVFRGCRDVIVTLALLCGVPLAGGNLRCARLRRLWTAQRAWNIRPRWK